jgi:hypothetical protein
MSRQVNLPTPALMSVTAWHDPIVEALGHRPGSPHIDTAWLGVVGLATAWAWLRLARIASTDPGASVAVSDFAQSLGLGARMGPRAPISRTLGRLVAFGVAHRSGDTLVVRRALPDVPQRLTPGQSAGARLAHQRLADTHASHLRSLRSVPSAQGAPAYQFDGPGVGL